MILTGIGLLLMILAAVALFVVIQESASYIASARGEFYTAVPNANDRFLERVLSPVSLQLLKFALWPLVLLIALEAVSSYCFGRVFSFAGRFSNFRRWCVGLATSLLITLTFLAVMWRGLQSIALR